ncbi:metallophosphatase [Bacteroidales bacterium OttesenSCG-928-B11]|nr:metallophosphatase [Bacteroidales bacterium OttesenSCG-928-E04]MDL2311974.1 metallophosphatase [Bacteroidales bacterium OttesenSCG-928-B11]
MTHYKILLFIAFFCPLLTFGQGKVLTILHTNDTHSQIEPWSDKKMKNVGGYARRDSVIRAAKENETPLLVVDAGDFSQGTPYFNFFGGYAEIEMMNLMGYEVATLGNHEFDNGVDALSRRLQTAQFHIVCANYEFKHKKLSKQVKPYVVLKKDDLKIGVYGLLVDLRGLVDQKTIDSTTYKDPIAVSKEIVPFLRNKKKCDLIICLSHLGFEDNPKWVSDSTLALAVGDIDIVVGGHTHRLLEDKVVNGVQIVQLEYGGMRIGKIDIRRKRK